MKTHTRACRFLSILLSTLSITATQAQSVNGSWAAGVSGDWSDATKWTGGSVADGSGGIATFNLDFSDPVVVNLDTSRTIGLIKYGDTGSEPEMTNLTITSPQGVVLTMASGGTPDITVGQTNVLIMDVVLGGTGGLTIGAATTPFAAGNNSRVYLNRPATYTGPTLATRGTLYLGVDNAIPVDSYVSINVPNGTGQLALNGKNQEIAGLTRGGSGTRRVINDSTTPATLTINVPEGASYAYASQLGDTRVGPTEPPNTFGLVKKGPGIQTIGGNNANPYSGETVVENGILETINGGALGDSSSGTRVLSGGTLRLAGTGTASTYNEALTISGAGYAGGGALVSTGPSPAWGGTVTLTGNTTITTETPLTIQAQVVESGGSYGITKKGSSSLVLSSPPSFNGPVLVEQGTFAAATDMSLPGGITVMDGAALSASPTLRVPSLTLGSTGQVTLEFSSPNTFSPVVVALDGSSGVPVQVNASKVVVKVSTVGLVPGAVPLLKYSALAGKGFAAFDKMPQLPPGVIGVVSNDTANSQITLHVSAIVNEVTWHGGVDNNWDLSTLNWNSGAARYQEIQGVGDIVNFTDSLEPTALRTNISLVGVLSPSIIKILNGSYAYAFEGTGKLSGTGALMKDGPMPLTIRTANDFSGGTTLTGGTLRIGNDSALGSGPIQFTLGSLTSDGAAARRITNAITLETDPVNIGEPGFEGQMTFAGPVYIGSMRQINAMADTVIEGPSGPSGLHKTGPGTLTLKGDADWSAASDINIYQGSVVLDGASMVVQQAIRMVPAVGGSVVRFVVGSGSTLTMLQGNNHYHVGQTGGDATATNILDVAGTIYPTITSTYVRLGETGAHAELNLLSGGILNVRDIRPGPAGNGYKVVNFRGGTFKATMPAANFLQNLSNAFVHAQGVIIDSDTNTVTAMQALEAPPSGPSGGLTKIGTGWLSLGGANTYAGPTLVNEGTLQLSEAHAGPGAITVADGAVLSLRPVVAGSTIQLPSAILGATAGASLDVAFPGTEIPTAPAAHIANLAISGTLTVDISSITPPASGSIPLVTYGTGGVGTVVTGLLPENVSGTIVNNTDTKTIELVVAPAAPPEITVVETDADITISWGAAYDGWILQGQTNTTAVGLSDNWADVEGAGSDTSITIAKDPSNGTVFFRLRKP